MTSNQKLKDFLVESLTYHKGKASIVQVCKYIWQNHREELENSGDLFYTWQYDVRWTAQRSTDG